MMPFIDKYINDAIYLWLLLYKYTMFLMNLQYVIPEIELRGGAKPLPVKIVKYYPSLNCPHHLASFSWIYGLIMKRLILLAI